nr:MAG TPA: hypothetical protein [Caudoviricetes sp.]
MKQNINSISIKGKSYSTVDARVSFFRENFKDYSIKTSFHFLDLEKNVALVKAEIISPSGITLSNAFAYEWQNKPNSLVNKTSFIENAETSAVGRALGFFGIGIIGGEAIATADELNLKIQHQQEEDIAPSIPQLPVEVKNEILSCSSIQDIANTLKKYAKDYDRNLLSELASTRKSELINSLQDSINQKISQN